MKVSLKQAMKKTQDRCTDADQPVQAWFLEVHPRPGRDEMSWKSLEKRSIPTSRRTPFRSRQDRSGRTRRRLLDMIATGRTAFLGYHMPFPAIGFVEKRGVGFRYVSKGYQFDF